MALGRQRGEMNDDGTHMKHLAIQEGQETDAEHGADGAHLKHLAKQEGQKNGPEPGAEGGRKTEEHERKANQEQDDITINQGIKDTVRAHQENNFQGKNK